MRTKVGLLVAFAAATLWMGNTTFAQSGSSGSGAASESSTSSQSSAQRGDQASSGMQGSSSGQGSSTQSGSSSQRGGSSSGSTSGQYGSEGSSSGQTGSSAGSSSQRGGATGSTGSRSGQSGTSSGMGGTTSSQDMGGTKTSRRGGRDASAQLEQNPALASKIGAMLPAGTSAQDAASGFKNLGEFVAAVHVSQNLNIPFDQLKTKITSGQSLDHAVKDLKPGVDKSEIKKAKDEAKEDLKSTKQ